jgi:CRP-like cAMP-binding protein
MESGQKDRYLKLIKNVNMFKFLADDELKDLLSESEIIHLKKGDRVIVEGDKSEHLYAVLEGTMDISINSDTAEAFIREIGEFEAFGETAIFSEQQRTAHVTSSGNSMVIRIHRAEILSFFKRHPTAGIKILMYMTNGLLTKLKQANLEIVMQREPEVGLDDIDPLIQNIMDNLD